MASDTAPFTPGPYDIKRAETDHTKYGFAYRFIDELTISGDKSPTPAVTEFAGSSNNLIHECAYPDGVETDGHTTPTELGTALAGITVDQIFLTHLFQEAEDVASDLTRNVAGYTDANVRVAEDLDTVTTE